MKTRKILLITAMFLFIMTLFAILPNKVLSVIPEGMSQEFKSILNEEGKLVVKDTTMLENKLDIINEYLGKYSITNGSINYNFYASNYDESLSKCTIIRNVFGSSTPATPEQYEIEVVFQEEYSQEFKNILKNGKLEIRSSSKTNKKEMVSRRVQALSNEKYSFAISDHYDYKENKTVSLINDECTKATIKMISKTTYKPVEQHIVEITYNTEKSEEFKSILNLNKDGNLVINGVKPTDENTFMAYFEFLIYKENAMMNYENLAEDFSSCDFTVNGETHNINIVYNYDNTVKQQMNNFIKNFPSNIEYFKVKDLELINYWVNNVSKDETMSLDMFSGELKSYLNYKNMKFYVDNRAGDNGPFYTLRLGIAVFKYNDIIYHIDDRLGTRAEHIIYVPNETGSTKEELIKAAQKRIDEYLGKEGIATVTYGGTAYEAWAKTVYDLKQDWPEMNPNMTFEEFLGLGNVFLPTYTNFEQISGFEGVTENDETFIVTVKVGNKQESFHILIKKDTSKMVTPEYKTADLTTNIEITSNSSSIPLDTSIQAKKITNGTEYEKIIKLLDVKENAMFDLKLYSESLGNYVTKLEDETFEVKIPVPENLKDKELIAYYTTNDGKTEKYDVEVKDGYAIFKTKHFSIYTLAENKSSLNGENNNTENTTGKSNTENATEENNTENTAQTSEVTSQPNPKTGDNIIVYIIIAGISIIVLGTAIIVKRRVNKQE